MKIRIGFIIKWVSIGTIVILLSGFTVTGVTLMIDQNAAYDKAMNDAYPWKITVYNDIYYSMIVPEVGPGIVTFIDAEDGKVKSFIGYRSNVESTKPIPVPEKKNLKHGG